MFEMKPRPDSPLHTLWRFELGVAVSSSALKREEATYERIQSGLLNEYTYFL